MVAHSIASAFPAEIWDMICEHIDAPGSRYHPRHGNPAANWAGQRDLKSVRLVNRIACRSASRFVFRSIGQTHSEKGARALSQLAGSQYASSVRALSMDIQHDLASVSSFEDEIINPTNRIVSILCRFPQLRTIWVMKYPLSRGPCGTRDWSGRRFERAKTLASTWLEAVKQLGPSTLKHLNLVFNSISQMKQFSAQLNADYPEGRPESWFQAIMVEESCGQLSKRSPHDVRSILSIMPLRSVNNNHLHIAGSIGRDDEYRAYRLLQYIPAVPHLQSLHLANVDFDGDSLERLLLCNATTLKFIELYGVTLRSTYWAHIFTMIIECCEQLESLRIGCLGYLLPVSSILDKLSDTEKEDKISDDVCSLTFLLQAVAERQWQKGVPPIVPKLFCTACESSRNLTGPSQEFSRSIEAIEAASKDSHSEPEDDPLVIANDDWKNMLWLHRQLWEG